jgi:hypothetical protein
MKNLLIVIQTLSLLCLTPLHAALADNLPDPYDAGAPYSDANFTAEELEDLVAPIALYPDPLIAQILPAATFIDQIDEAARYVKLYGTSARIDRQTWDVSVKAVAHYPDILLMMDQKYDWTVSLGQAFVNQPEDVMLAIQNLRADALAAGNLVTTSQQQVVVEGDDIRIYPAQPQVIYVPVYDPQLVYYEHPAPGYGLITFGAGFGIGVWLNRDFDWHDRRVYYHGWQGGGWIARSRPSIQIRNTVYVNNRSTVININRTVVQRDTVRYRAQVRRDVSVRREQPGRPVPAQRDRRTPVRNEPLKGRPVPPAIGQPRSAAPVQDRRAPTAIDNREVKPGQPASGQPRPASSPRDQRPSGVGVIRDDKPKPAVPGQPQTATPFRDQRTPARIDTRDSKPAPAPAAAQAPAPKPVPQDVSRGRDTQKTQPASRSGYGGYGSSKDAGAYRERGAASQENMRSGNRPASAPQAAPQQRPPVVQQPAPAQRPAAVQRPAAPASPKPAAPPAPRREAPADRGEKDQRQQR